MRWPFRRRPRRHRRAEPPTYSPGRIPDGHTVPAPGQPTIPDLLAAMEHLAAAQQAQQAAAMEAPTMVMRPLRAPLWVRPPWLPS